LKKRKSLFQFGGDKRPHKHPRALAHAEMRVGGERAVGRKTIAQA
jgi:hypothetical protein